MKSGTDDNMIVVNETKWLVSSETMSDIYLVSLYVVSCVAILEHTFLADIDASCGNSELERKRFILLKLYI